MPRSRRSVLTALAAGSVSALAGCGGSSEPGTTTATGTSTNGTSGSQGSGQGYRFHRGNVGRTGNFPERTGPGEGLSQSWQFESAEYFSSQPIVANGLVYAIDDGGTAYAYDSSTQEKVWESDIGTMGGWSPAVTGGLVYAPGRNDSLYALDASTGTEEWRHDTGYGNVRTPAVADGTVYVTSSDSGGGKLTALNASSGESKWERETDTPAAGPPAVSDGTVYYYNNGVMAVNSSGDKEWNVVDSGYEKFGVTTDGDSVYFIKSGVESNQYVDKRLAEVVAVDAEDGSEQWRYEDGTTDFGGLAADGSAVYTTSGGSVYKLDAESGTEEWSVEGGATHEPVLYGESLYLARGSDTFSVLDKSDGTERWGAEFNNGDYEPVVVDGTLYMSVENTVRAFE